MVLEKTPESHLDWQEIKPVNPKENWPWIFTGRTDAQEEAPILGQLMQRADSYAKTLMLGKIGAKEEEVGWGANGYIASLTQWEKNLSKFWETVNNREACCAGLSMQLQRVGIHLSTELQKHDT